MIIYEYVDQIDCVYATTTRQEVLCAVLYTYLSTITLPVFDITLHYPLHISHQPKKHGNHTINPTISRFDITSLQNSISYSLLQTNKPITPPFH